MCNFGISGVLWISVSLGLSHRPRTESCHWRNKFYMVCYSIRRTSGLLIGPFVLCNFHWWFAWSSNAWKLCVIICWRLQNIQDYKLSSWSFRISVRAQLFERRLALTRGQILTLVSFSVFLSKAHYRIIFSILFRVSSHQIVGKEN